MTERDAKLKFVRGERQRGDELMKERDSQMLSQRTTANKAESGWRTREKEVAGRARDGSVGRSAPLPMLCETGVS